MTDDPLLPVAADLRAILDLHRDLPQQAANHATSRLMPGGLAMVALGPVASPEAVGYVVDSIENGRLDCADEIPDNDDDWEPPLQTLRFWSEEWRRLHDREVDGWTVRTEAGFLLTALQWAWDNEPHWDDFAKDVRAARRRLEDVLHDGEREERSWVPCLDCSENRQGLPIAVRLVRYWGTVAAADGWICPRCKRLYGQTEFNLALSAALQRNQESEGAA